MNDLEFEAITEDIFEEMKYLERLYNKDYLTLKQYYEIKSNIITKYIAVGEEYKEFVKKECLNDRQSNINLMEIRLF